MNLDKFTSFPHCAACGARLPLETPRAGVWMRPVRPALWFSVVGLGVATLAAGILGVVRETRTEGEHTLVVDLKLPKRARVGQAMEARFTLDSRAEGSSTLEEVRLRWSREMARDFRLIEIKPPPDVDETVGSGRYLEWNELAPRSPIQFQLAPRRAGVLELRVGILVRDHARAQPRESVRVVQ